MSLARLVQVSLARRLVRALPARRRPRLTRISQSGSGPSDSLWLLRQAAGIGLARAAPEHSGLCC